MLPPLRSFVLAVAAFVAAASSADPAVVAEPPVSDATHWNQMPAESVDGYRFQERWVRKLLVLTTGAAPRNRPRVASCCVCLRNNESRSAEACRQKMQDFASDASRGCDVVYTYKVSEAPNARHSVFQAPYSCDSIHAYGAFHGSAHDTRAPFSIARFLAAALDAHSVCYDGVTCEVFTDTKAAFRAGQETARLAPGTHFSVGGNQLVGLDYPDTHRVNENAQTSFFVNVDPQGGVTWQLHDCQPQGALCAKRTTRGFNHRFT